MCTAVFDTKCGNLFGRTLDLEYSLGEEVVICPRNFAFPFRNTTSSKRKFAIMGTAHVRDGIPLFYDCVNEAGVAAAALNFPISAKYADFKEGKINLASFELIPYILGKSQSLAAVMECLSEVNVTSDAFSRELPPTPLHWMFADKSGSVVLESTELGLKIYENPVGVLTNEPCFNFQLTRLADYAGLGALPSQNTIAGDYEPVRYSRGLGAFGLPGDFSSASRFVRAVFVKNHTSSGGAGKIERFFHIMNSVSVPRGCVVTDEGREVETVYTSCIDLDSLTYYFTIYASPVIRSYTFHVADCSNGELVRPL